MLQLNFLYIAARYLVVLFRLAIDFRNNPRFSCRCLFLLMTTAQEVQGDGNNIDLPGASTQTVTSGPDTVFTAVNECFDIDCEISSDGPSAQRRESFTARM